MKRLIPWLVAAATFLTFIPALESLFVNWDDTANFLENPDFKNAGLGELRWMFSTFHLAHYQPVTWLTWGLDKALWGTNPFGYHLTNLVIHCATAAIFCLLCRRVLDRVMPESSDFHPYAAAWAALLFAVHPLRVEAVAWATERRELLSSFLFLSAAALYLRPRGRSHEAPKPGLHWVLVLGALAMLSNVRTVSLPLALLLLDYYPLGRLSATRPGADPGVWKEKAPFFLLAFGVGLIGLLAQATTSTLIPVAKAGFVSRAVQSCFGVGFYLWKSLAPFGLSNWYGDSYLEARAPVAVLGAAAAVFLTAGLAWRAKTGRGKALLACWLWYLVTLFPSLGIVKSGRQIVADRYSYLPCIAFALLAAAGLCKLRTLSREGHVRRWVFIGVAAGAVACLPLLSGLTWQQCRVWNDSVSLWSRAFAIDPRSVFIRTNFGIALLQARRFQEAVKAFETITEDAVDGMDPDSGRSFFSFIRFLSAMAHNNWGVDLMTRGRPVEAVPHFQKALFYNPESERGHFSLGLALLRSGRLDEAIPRFEAAVKASPDLLDGRLHLGEALALKGRRKDAEAQFRAVLRLAPDPMRAAKAREGLRRLGRVDR
ncbi:MAG: tetratricopeptide repeat protein [Elusimicrobia bacterium]|nr:tetratricopeptide repeat protein [Elusimicrobiota bacterium]